MKNANEGEKVSGVLNDENISFERSHHELFSELFRRGWYDWIPRRRNSTINRDNASASLVVDFLGGEAINRRIGLIPSLSSKIIGFLICARREYGMSISLAGISWWIPNTRTSRF